MTICYPVLAAPGLAYSVQPGLGFCAPAYLRATGSVHTGAQKLRVFRVSPTQSRKAS